MNEIMKQQSLGEFLRATRARITPEQVDLPSHGRRRTPGLRREEVAQLANVGVSWYTSIEQGKDVHPSYQVLESLAKVLKMSEDERRYLFLLAKSDEIEEVYRDKEISIGLEQTVFALEPHPAYLLGKYWDVLVWNRAAEFIFQFPSYTRDVPPQLNLLTHFLIDSHRTVMPSDWEDHAKVMIARFRADCARYPQDKRLNEMIEKFKQESELFRLWWPRYEVKTITDCHKVQHHPIIGKLEFEHVNFHLSNYQELKLMVFTGSPSTADKLKQELNRAD